MFPGGYSFCHLFNGKCIALNCAPIHDIYLDTSNLGAGYVFASDWGYTDWKVDLPTACDLHINIKKSFLQYWQPGAGSHCGLILESYTTQTI